MPDPDRGVGTYRALLRLLAGSGDAYGRICEIRIKKTKPMDGSGLWRTYRALVRLFAGVATHVDNEHILRLEGLLLSRTVPPLAHEMLLVRVDMVVGDVLKQRKITWNK